MTTEEDTFKALKRTPISEMCRIIDDLVLNDSFWENIDQVISDNYWEPIEFADIFYDHSIETRDVGNTMIADSMKRHFEKHIKNGKS